VKKYLKQEYQNRQRIVNNISHLLQCSTAEK